MTTDTTTFAPFLKTLWPQDRVENLALRKQPFFAMVPKDKNFEGANAVITLQYADDPGRSAALATAQTNSGSLAAKAFTITRKKDYAVARVDGETMKASRSNKGALASAWDRAMKSSINAISRAIGVDLYRAGSGSRGRRSGALSGNVLTLTELRDVVNFEVGMKVVASTTDSSSGLRAGTAAVIDSIDRDAGTLTSTTWGNITSFGANDYLFVEGDPSAKITGLAGWLPTTAPAVGGGDSFFSVDRSADPVRLAGKRVDISALPPQEGLVHAVNRLAIEGGMPTHMFCHFDQYTNIEHALGAKIEYEDLSVGEVGFRAIKVNGPYGPVMVLPDVNCPASLAYLLQLDTWTLMSLGDMPGILDLDTLQMLRVTNADTYEVRVGYYAQLACNAPGWNAVLTMPTLP